MTYRVGRSLGRTIYRQTGAEASKQDVFIGIMDTRGDAAMVVEALTGPRRAAGPLVGTTETATGGFCSYGRGVYRRVGGLDHFMGMMDTRDDAAMVADALNEWVPR